MSAPLKLIVATFLWVLMAWMFLLFAPHVQAQPPNPRQHIHWAMLPNGNAVLQYMINGQIIRLVYRMVHEVTPARECAPVYSKKTFKLLSFSTTFPYWYEFYTDPIMRWDVLKKEFVSLE